MKEKLGQWKKFFSCYQVPPQFLALRAKVAKLEKEVARARASRLEGYTDPASGAFVKASSGKMAMMISTHDDETIRKACWEAKEVLAVQNVAALVELVNLRNEYARALGYEDFYAYKLHIGEGMTKAELFALCDEIYERTKYGFQNVREMEKTRPGFRKPWNFAYMLGNDLIKKKDPYIQFTEAVPRWGRSFAALGVNFQGATLRLDLLDREGKHNNGFCHWPRIVHFKNGVRIPGECNFTSNAVSGQVGAGAHGATTLNHEGGHAAHLTNTEMTETCMNIEYAPSSVAWAETQSMFMDTMGNSVEWLMRYAQNAAGQAYPFELYEESVRRYHPIEPLDFMSMLSIMNLERELYTTSGLSEEKTLEIAKRMHQKYYDREVDSFALLGVPHLYSWESACYCHGYGLATLALNQWREYFYKKYGYIVDNPAVGFEMREVWKLGGSRSFSEFVVLATGEKLSAEPYLKVITSTVEDTLALARERIAKLETVPERTDPVDLNAKIFMMDGKNSIADNSRSFEHMVDVYREWVRSKEKAAG
jgi:Zn-dependent oligopeptidase